MAEAAGDTPVWAALLTFTANRAARWSALFALQMATLSLQLFSGIQIVRQPGPQFFGAIGEGMVLPHNIITRPCKYLATGPSYVGVLGENAVTWDATEQNLRAFYDKWLVSRPKFHFDGEWVERPLKLAKDHGWGVLVYALRQSLEREFVRLPAIDSILAVDFRNKRRLQWQRGASMRLVLMDYGLGCEGTARVNRIPKPMAEKNILAFMQEHGTGLPDLRKANRALEFLTLQVAKQETLWVADEAWTWIEAAGGQAVVDSLGVLSGQYLFMIRERWVQLGQPPFRFDLIDHMVDRAALVTAIILEGSCPEITDQEVDDLAVRVMTEDSDTSPNSVELTAVYGWANALSPQAKMLYRERFAPLFHSVPLREAAARVLAEFESYGDTLPEYKVAEILGCSRAEAHLAMHRPSDRPVPPCLLAPEIWSLLVTHCQESDWGPDLLTDYFKKLVELAGDSASPDSGVTADHMFAVPRGQWGELLNRVELVDDVGYGVDCMRKGMTWQLAQLNAGASRDFVRGLELPEGHESLRVAVTFLGLLCWHPNTPGTGVRFETALSELGRALRENKTISGLSMLNAVNGFLEDSLIAKQWQGAREIPQLDAVQLLDVIVRACHVGSGGNWTRFDLPNLCGVNQTTMHGWEELNMAGFVTSLECPRNGTMSLAKASFVHVGTFVVIRVPRGKKKWIPEKLNLLEETTPGVKVAVGMELLGYVGVVSTLDGTQSHEVLVLKDRGDVWFVHDGGAVPAMLQTGPFCSTIEVAACFYERVGRGYGATLERYIATHHYVEVGRVAPFPTVFVPAITMGSVKRTQTADGQADGDPSAGLLGKYKELCECGKEVVKWQWEFKVVISQAAAQALVLAKLFGPEKEACDGYWRDLVIAWLNRQAPGPQWNVLVGMPEKFPALSARRKVIPGRYLARGSTAGDATPWLPQQHPERQTQAQPARILPTQVNVIEGSLLDLDLSQREEDHAETVPRPFLGRQPGEVATRAAWRSGATHISADGFPVQGFVPEWPQMGATPYVAWLPDPLTLPALKERFTAMGCKLKASTLTRVLGEIKRLPISKEWAIELLKSCAKPGQEGSFTESLERWNVAFDAHADCEMVHMAVCMNAVAHVPAFLEQNQIHIFGGNIDMTLEALVDPGLQPANADGQYARVAACLAVVDGKVVAYRRDPRKPENRIIEVLPPGHAMLLREIKVMAHRDIPPGQGANPARIVSLPVGQLVLNSPWFQRPLETVALPSSAVNVCMRVVGSRQETPGFPKLALPWLEVIARLLCAGDTAAALALMTNPFNFITLTKPPDARVESRTTTLHGASGTGKQAYAHPMEITLGEKAMHISPRQVKSDFNAFKMKIGWILGGEVTWHQFRDMMDPLVREMGEGGAFLVNLKGVEAFWAKYGQFNLHIDGNFLEFVYALLTPSNRRLFEIMIGEKNPDLLLHMWKHVTGPNKDLRGHEAYSLPFLGEVCHIGLNSRQIVRGDELSHFVRLGQAINLPFLRQALDAVLRNVSRDIETFQEKLFLGFRGSLCSYLREFKYDKNIGSDDHAFWVSYLPVPTFGGGGERMSYPEILRTLALSGMGNELFSSCCLALVGIPWATFHTYSCCALKLLAILDSGVMTGEAGAEHKRVVQVLARDEIPAHGRDLWQLNHNRLLDRVVCTRLFQRYRCCAEAIHVLQALTDKRVYLALGDFYQAIPVDMVAPSLYGADFDTLWVDLSLFRCAVASGVADGVAAKAFVFHQSEEMARLTCLANNLLATALTIEGRDLSDEGMAKAHELSLEHSRHIWQALEIVRSLLLQLTYMQKGVTRNVIFHASTVFFEDMKKARTRDEAQTEFLTGWKFESAEFREELMELAGFGEANWKKEHHKIAYLGYEGELLEDMLETLNTRCVSMEEAQLAWKAVEAQQELEVTRERELVEQGRAEMQGEAVAAEALLRVTDPAVLMQSMAEILEDEQTERWDLAPAKLLDTVRDVHQIGWDLPDDVIFVNPTSSSQWMSLLHKLMYSVCEASDQLVTKHKALQIPTEAKRMVEKTQLRVPKTIYIVKDWLGEEAIMREKKWKEFDL
jgi:hypothetical protein